MEENLGLAKGEEMKRFRWYMQRNFADDTMHILIKKLEDGIHYRAKIVWEEAPNGVPCDMTLKMSSDEFDVFEKQLINALHSEGSLKQDRQTIELKAHLEAKDSHLQDMRKLVFKD